MSKVNVSWESVVCVLMVHLGLEEVELTQEDFAKATEYNHVTLEPCPDKVAVELKLHKEPVAEEEIEGELRYQTPEIINPVRFRN